MKYVQKNWPNFGELESLVDESLVNYCQNFANIAVAGFTKSGKSLIASKLAEKLGRNHIQSDKFIGDNDWKSQLKIFRQNINSGDLISGVHVVRLINKPDLYRPDLLIWCDLDLDCIEYCYENSNEIVNYDKIYQFNVQLSSAFEKFADSDYSSEILVLDTSFEVPDNDSFYGVGDA